MSLSAVIDHFPPDLRGPISELATVLRSEVTHEDFDGLKAVVLDLAQAQKRTENRVEELAQAQKRTENRVEELAQAQTETQQTLTGFSREFRMQIGALGARWGIKAEGAFRSGMAAILKDTGYTVEHFEQRDATGVVFGYAEQVELDIIVKNGKTIVVEMKSAAEGHHVHLFTKKAVFYEQATGRKADELILISPAPSPKALILGRKLGVIICQSYEETRETI